MNGGDTAVPEGDSLGRSPEAFLPFVEGASKFGGIFDVKMGSLLSDAMPAGFCGLIFATSGGVKPCVNWGGFANYHQTWMHPYQWRQ